jgi:hypothetical protein
VNENIQLSRERVEVTPALNDFLIDAIRKLREKKISTFWSEQSGKLVPWIEKERK